MSIDKVKHQEVEPLMAWRRLKGNTNKSSQVFHRPGGVGDDSMLRRECVGGREISHCGGKPPTMDTSSQKNKIQTAVREVGSSRSSSEAPVMGVEQRRGRSANMSEVARERFDGSRDLPTEGSTEKMTRVRKLQRTLYRQAKSKPKWRAWSLYGDLCSRDILEEALWKVIANGGGPGVDGLRVEILKDDESFREQWLTKLQSDLKDKSYKPSPIKRVCIPKGNGKMRPLGIPTVRDRVAQQGVKLLLEPIFEADFHENSYAYRPKKNAHQAIDKTVEALKSGRIEVIDADLSGYFDTIPHAQLIRLIKRRVSDGSILKLIKEWLRAEIVEEDRENGKKRMIKNRRGTPQGGVISPLLANIYLDDLDKAVNTGKKMKAVMVRFADDCLVLCPKGKGKQVYEQLRKWLERRELILNEEKTRIVNMLYENIEFLGFRMVRRKSPKGKNYYHTEPSPKACAKMREAIREETRRNALNKDAKAVFGKVNQRLRGWAEYYHYGNSTRVFSKMQNHVNEQMRRWLWKKHNKKHGRYSHYQDERLYNHYGIIKLPLYEAWKYS